MTLEADHDCKISNSVLITWKFPWRLDWEPLEERRYCRAGFPSPVISMCFQHPFTNKGGFRFLTLRSCSNVIPTRVRETKKIKAKNVYDKRSFLRMYLTYGFLCRCSGNENKRTNTPHPGRDRLHAHAFRSGVRDGNFTTLEKFWWWDLNDNWTTEVLNSWATVLEVMKKRFLNTLK